MLTAEENDLLTRVGPETPMGRVLRRYWWPVGFSEELTTKPKHVRLLGEDLVLFRLPAGEVGLLALRCAHRAASLQYGRVEADGIRCCYHGWLWARNGRCLDQPAEADGSTFKDRVQQTAYVASELGGLVFAYLGPAPAPSLPKYDVLVHEGGRRTVRAFPNHNNWLQSAENAADMSHLMWLHAGPYPQFAGKRPIIDWVRTDYGLHFDIHDMPGVDEPNVGSVILPAHNRFASKRLGQPASHMLVFRVPHDDYLTTYFIATLLPDNTASTTIETIGQQHREAGVYQTVEDGWWGIASEDQDRMAQESQGPIVDRTTEHLAESDRGVTMFRNLLREALRDVAAGRDPQGVLRDERGDAPITFDANFDLVPALAQ